MTAKIAIGLLLTCVACTPASATVLHFRTTSTSGIFQEVMGSPDIPDTSAAFSFDVSYTDPSDLTLYNGVFKDSNKGLGGASTTADNLMASGVDYYSGSGTLANNDGAVLSLTLDFSSTNPPFFSGNYTFNGPQGEFASGTFDAQTSNVPLPASAPMFGAALIAVAGLGYGARRKKTAAVG